MDEEEESGIALPLLFVGMEEVPILYANHFLVQHQQGGEFIITVGQVQGPPLLGTREERIEQAKRLAYVPIRVVARLALTRERMAELIGALEENVKGFDTRAGG